jgi:hypothetical protein
METRDDEEDEIVEVVEPERTQYIKSQTTWKNMYENPWENMSRVVSTLHGTPLPARNHLTVRINCLHRTTLHVKCVYGTAAVLSPVMPCR